MITKDKILKSALKLFTKQGIDKTSTQQITDDVGIASGTLFVHFKTKQELIDELYISIKKNSFGHIAGTIDESTSVESMFKHITRAIIEHYLSHYNEFVFIGLVENDPQVSESAQKIAKESYKDITVAVQQWQKDGYLKDIDIELLGGIIWSTISSIIRYCKGNKMKEVDNSYLDLVWEAVKR